MSFFEKFIRGSTRIAKENGTQKQIDELSWRAAESASFLGELGDQMGGRETRNYHHSASDLSAAIVDGISGIVGILFEIKRSEEERK